MPPLIVAALVGAGAYAGFKALQHILARDAGLASGSSQTSAPSAVEKDLGRLELDPVTGIYRPPPPSP